MDEDFLLNIDAPLEERIASIENQVLELTLKNCVELPPTAKIQEDFLVVNNRIFTRDQYQGIAAYDLNTGKPISSIVLDSYRLKGMATDGKSLFLHMHGIDFKLKNSDIVIAKNLNPESYFNIVDFVGRYAEEVEGVYSYSEASKSGISEAIFPIPLDLISRHSIMFSPILYSENDADVPRFLVHPDMSMTNIASGPGFINVFYNYHHGEGGCETGCRIENNKICEDYGNLSLFKERTSDRKIPWNLNISINRDEIFAFYSLFGNEYDDLHTFTLPIVFKGSGRKGKGLVCLQQDDDIVHLLYNHNSWKPARQFTIMVSEPFILETYEAKIMKLTPADERESKP